MGDSYDFASLIFVLLIIIVWTIAGALWAFLQAINGHQPDEDDQQWEDLNR